MGGDNWTPDEMRLTLECQSLKEFALQYIEKFGVPSRASRINNIWTMRKKIRDDMCPVPKPQGKSTVLATGGVVDEESVTLVNISNKLSEILQVQKEQLELFKKALKKEETNDSVVGSGP